MLEPEIDVNQIIREIASRTGADPTRILVRDRTPKVSLTRHLAVWVVVTRGMSIGGVARAFRRHPATVLNVVCARGGAQRLAGDCPSRAPARGRWESADHPAQQPRFKPGRLPAARD